MTRNLSFLHLIISLTIISGIETAACSESSAQKIMETVDLAHDGQKSEQTTRPILLLVSKTGCPYCITIKNEVLNPMHISTEYRNKIIIRELILNPANVIRDFDGTATKVSDIADKYMVKVTPTLLFLGPNGEELAKKIIGINTVELFSYYVDQAIDIATHKLHSQ